MKNALQYFKEHPNDNFLDVAAQFNVDRKSLRNRVSGALPVDAQTGRQTFLTPDEERKLVQHCVEMAWLWL
jgi:hypothetical protein